VKNLTHLKLIHTAENTSPTETSKIVASHATSVPTVIYLRDGEVVIYRRKTSPLYQCRYKLADGTWHRVSTRKASVENAVRVACEMYDEARFRQRLGLTHTTHRDTFTQLESVETALHTSTNTAQNIDGTQYVFDLHSERRSSKRLLIRWSRVRISPDPPVIQRDHRNVVPFLLVSGNVVTTRKQ